MLRSHPNGPGLVVHGRFNRLRGWTPKGGWSAVAVVVDGRPIAALDQLKPGPLWLPLTTGSHDLRVVVDREGPVFEHSLKVSGDRVYELKFVARDGLPFARLLRKPVFRILAIR